MALLTVASWPSQQLAAQRRPEPPIELAMEQLVRDRWMHGRQQRRFTPFTRSRSWLLIDSLRSKDGGERQLHLTLGQFAYGRDSGLVVFGPDGRVARLDATSRSPAQIPFALPGDSARSARRRLFNGGRLTLPEPRLWDLVPTFRTAAARPGARWTDTLTYASDHQGFRQALRGVRVSTVVGDTTIDGRQLWIVRDSARIRYEERWIEDERTLDTLVTITRAGEGFVRGRHLYDPELGLFRARDDTTELSGEAVMAYPESYAGVRTFRTPARYQRFRHWILYDQARYSARQAELRESAERSRGGMVIVANTDIEKRLAAGDTTARDSLLTEWRRSDDPDRREVLFGLLTRWLRNDTQFRKRLDSIRVAAGDTAYLYDRLARRAFSTDERPDTAEIRLMLAFMQDPGRAFSIDRSRDWLYENLNQALTTWPPAVTRNTRYGPCASASCRLLTSQWYLAREPRLRELGLVALFAIDPKQWADTVLARSDAGSQFLRQAAMLARGVGATWSSASKRPIPEPNASWQDWAEWMNGVDQRYAAMAARIPGQPRNSGTPRPRFEESHATAIRFFEARTGRNVVEELRRGFEASASDTARLAYGTMLQGLGELRLTSDQMAAYFHSGDVARVNLAMGALQRLFASESQLADSATAVALLDRLVALSVEGVPAWRSLDGNPAGWGSRGPELHSASRRDTYFLLADSMPPGLREKWKGRVGIVTADEWKQQPATDAATLYTLSSVRRVGPFALVEISASERAARRPGDAPRLFAAGIRYFLMERDGEWVVVSSDQWVT